MQERTVKTRFKPTRKTFIREWRKFRGYTLEELAEKIGVTPTAISNIETLRSGYTQGMLETLAQALECEPWELICRDPSESTAEIDPLWQQANARQKRQIVDMARIIVGNEAA